jgi:hypothetical protein
MFAQAARSRTSSGLGYLLPLCLGLFGLGLLAAWRLDCVQLGPDPDTDAYGHFVIARQLLETPWNLKIHWVWLPFFHVLLALGVQLGATLDHVRSSNAILAAFPPLVLLWALSPRTPRQSDTLRPSGAERGLPYLAAFIAAVTPTFNQVGTSGQMEVLFSLLLIAAAALLARQRYGSSALLLSIAALTRYEAWAAVAAIGIVLFGRRVFKGERVGWAAISCVAAPALVVLAWATARWWGGEPWFGFILDNQQFAEKALETRVPAPTWQLAALGRYVVTVPLRVLGVASVFALLGVARTYRRHGVWLVALPLGVVGFLTLTSLTRSQLGLDRHFVSVVPFAAAWAAHGVRQVADWVSQAWVRLARPAAVAERSRQARIGALCFAVLSALVCSSALLRLQVSMHDWQAVTTNALPDARLAGRYLQTTPEGSLIVCDEASVEVTSGLKSSRFVRARVNDGSIRDVRGLAQSRDVYVMTRAERLRGLTGLGDISYGSLDGPADGFAALHVAAAHVAGFGSGVTSRPIKPGAPPR